MIGGRRSVGTCIRRARWAAGLGLVAALAAVLPQPAAADVSLGAWVQHSPDDLTVASARTVAGERLIIGVSASTPDAVQPGADYVGCGPAFATPLKPQKKVIGPAGIAALASAVTIPVFAIGGIDASNVSQLTAVGIRRACVIRAVADAADPEEATRRLRAILTA